MHNKCDKNTLHINANFVTDIPIKMHKQEVCKSDKATKNLRS